MCPQEVACLVTLAKYAYYLPNLIICMCELVKLTWEKSNRILKSATMSKIWIKSIIDKELDVRYINMQMFACLPYPFSPNARNGGMMKCRISPTHMPSNPSSKPFMSQPSPTTESCVWERLWLHVHIRLINTLLDTSDIWHVSTQILDQLLDVKILSLMPL